MTLQAALLKPCRVCGGDFTPFQSTQVVCGVRCARRVPVIARKEARAERVKTKKRLEDMQPLGYWVKQAQAAFNAWIRERDAALSCISCGSPTAKQWHAGHYLTVGARPELRFDEQNVHKQCSQCNDYLSGNLVRYRIMLIARLGQAEVDRLEGPQGPKRYRVDDLKAIRDDYRARLRALKGATHD